MKVLLLTPYRIMVSLLLLLGSCGIALAQTTYYVNPTTGLDSRNSSQAQRRTSPWATISKAVTEASAGDIIYVMPGAYTAEPSNTITVNKRLTIIGEDSGVAYSAGSPNRINAQFLITATGGSASNRVILKNLPVANVNTAYTFLNNGGTQVTQCAIIIKASFVTIENCKIRHSGQTTLGLGAANAGIGYGIGISRISASERDYEDIIIEGNHFAAMQTGIWIEDDVNLNMSSESYIIMRNNYFDRLTGHGIVFDERDPTLIGKAKNILVENNQIIMNSNVAAAAPTSQSHMYYGFKGDNLKISHNTGVELATAFANIRPFQFSYRGQGAIESIEFLNSKIYRNVVANGFINAIYFVPEYRRVESRTANPGCAVTLVGAGADYSTPSTFSRYNNITINGLYSIRTHSPIFSQFNTINHNISNSYLPRNRQRANVSSASIALFTSDQFENPAPPCTAGAIAYANRLVKLYEYGKGNQVINNNFLDSTAFNSSIQYLWANTSGSNILTGVDPSTSPIRNISTSAATLLAGRYVHALAPTGLTVSSVSGNNINLSDNSTTPNAVTVRNFTNTSVASDPVKVFLQAYDEITLTNTQSAPFLRTNSAGVAQTASGDFGAAIVAASPGDNVYAYFGTMGTSQGAFTIDKTINLVNVGCDRFDSSTAVRYLNLTIATGATVTLKGDMYTRGDLTINGTLDLNGFALICNGGINYGAEGKIKGGAGSQIIFNTPNTRNNVNLKMDNSTAASSTLDYLIVNMAIAGSPTITMQSNVIIAKQLNIIRGRLAVGANRLTIQDMPVLNPSFITTTTSSELYYEGIYPHTLPNLSAGIARLGLMGANKYWAASLVKTLIGLEMGVNATLENGSLALDFAGEIVSTASSRINTSGVTIMSVAATSNATLPLLGNAVGNLTLDAGANTITFRNNPIIAFDFLSTGKIQFADGNVHFQGEVLAEEFVGNNNIRLYFEKPTAGTQEIGTVYPAVKSIYLNRGGAFNLNISSGDVYVTDSLVRVSGTGNILASNGDVFTSAYITPTLVFTGDANSSVYYRATGSGPLGDRIFNGVDGDSVVFEISSAGELNATQVNFIIARHLNIKSGKIILNEDMDFSNSAVVRAGATAVFNAGIVLSGTANFSAENNTTIELLGTDGLAATGATGAIQVTGTRTLSAGTFVRYLASGTLSTGTMIPDNIRKIEVNNAGGDLRMSKSLNIDTLITTAGKMNLNGFKLTLDGAGALGTLNLDGGTAGSRLEIAGSGTGNYATINFSGLAELDSLRMNRTSGIITLGSALTINNGLAMNAGRIITTNTNRIILRDNAIATGGNATSFVDGPLTKIGNDAFTFPIGQTNTYAPLAISAPVNADAEFRATFFRTGNANTGPSFMNPGLANVTVNQYYDLTRVSVNPADSVNVTLFWNNGPSIGITDLPDLRVAHYNSSITKWENFGNSGTTGTIAAGSITSEKKLNNFSPVAIGSATADNPLPVTLARFQGAIVNGAAELSWLTFSELNNKGFSIQRSVGTDGNRFETIGFVKGAGNSNRLNQYKFTDANLFGAAWYRLVQEDFDGKTETSQAILLKLDDNASLKLSALTNPFEQSLTLQVESSEAQNGILIIVDKFGRKIYSADVILKAGFTAIENLLTGFPAGMYFVQLNTTKGKASVKVVKQ